MEQVIITVGADAEVKVEAQGVRGPGCAALTRAIEAAIGRVTSDVKKPEFYQASTQGAGQQAKNTAG